MSTSLESRPWIKRKLDAMEAKAEGQRSVVRAMADQGAMTYQGQSRNDMQVVADANDSLIADIARALAIKIKVLPGVDRDGLKIAREMRTVLDDVMPLLIDGSIDRTMKQVIGTLLLELSKEFAAS